MLRPTDITFSKSHSETVTARQERFENDIDVRLASAESWPATVEYSAAGTLTAEQSKKVLDKYRTDWNVEPCFGIWEFTPKSL
jgi:predicted nucleotidyltransferase